MSHSLPDLPPAVQKTLAALCDGRPLAIFDLETTGTDRLNDRIVEVAVLRLHPGGEVVTLDQRVNPGVRIPREATEIHGISDADVENSPTFAAVAADLAAFLEGSDLAGYNIRGFDLPLLAKEFERARQPFSLEGRRLVDAQTIFFKKEPRDLAAAVRTFAGREHTGAHNALADVVATAEVLAGEIARYPDLPATLAGLHDFSAPAEGRFVDPDKRFLWRDGKAVFAFGEHRGRPLADVARTHPAYLEWIARADFPAEAKKIVTAALAGTFPTKG
jgi:DNA polymerase-3 subunit epsilon